MFIKKQSVVFLLGLICVSEINAYDFTGLNAAFNFGTLASPFTTITLTDGTICVGYTLGSEAATYRVQATSSGSSTTAFQMTNSSSSTTKLTYQVAWAGSTGGSPTYVTLSSGQSSSSAFNAQILGGLTCALLASNATLQLQLTNANQQLARQGSYTDTLMVLIVPP